MTGGLLYYDRARPRSRSGSRVAFSIPESTLCDPVARQSRLIYIQLFTAHRMPRRRRRFRINLPLVGAVALFVLAIVAYVGISTLVTAWTPPRRGVPQSAYLVFLARSLDVTLAVWFFAVGASIGSFLNVVAYRVPLGRTLGGHSACPYCTEPIAATDNIPVFAWLRLRGRCRTCRLPISIQYPLVELAVGLVFLFAYFSEFGIASSNLPGTPPRPMGLGLVWMSVSQQIVVRILVYLFALSGVIAAALIVIRHSRPPVVMFAWLLIVMLGLEVIYPTAVVVPWRASPFSWTPEISSRLQALATLGFGGLAGMALAILLLPLIWRGSNAAGWIGVMTIMGALFGWQFVPLATLCVLLATLGGWAMTRLLPAGMSSQAALAEPVVWAWLGMVILRANWNTLDAIQRHFSFWPPYGAWIAVCSVCAVLAWIVGQCYQSSKLGELSSAVDPCLSDTAAPSELLSHQETTVRTAVAADLPDAVDREDSQSRGVQVDNQSAELKPNEPVNQQSPHEI